MALFTKKTWKNRMSEYPTRRRLTKENGTTELVTVARSEGTVSQEGDAFSADNMNNLEDRILRAIGTGDIPKELGADIVSAINALNTGIKSNRISSAKYGFISVVNLKALDWTYYSIPHSLGSVPEFILLTPMTMNAGRFAWKVTALTDTTINIDIYNWESSGYSVAFYYLITK